MSRSNNHNNSGNNNAEQRAPSGNNHQPIPRPSAKVVPKGQLASLLRGRADMFGVGQDIGRSTSAPPTQLFTSNVDESDMRANPDYAAYFHSNSRLDPRLPPPIYAPGQSWQMWTNGPPGLASSPGGGEWARSPRVADEQTEEGYDPRYPQPMYPGQQQSDLFMPGAKNSSSPNRRRNLVDMIQQDFPRTPSPVFAMQMRQEMSMKSGILSVAVANAALMDGGFSSEDFDRGSTRTPPPNLQSSIPPPRSSSTPPIAGQNQKSRFAPAVDNANFQEEVSELVTGQFQGMSLREQQLEFVRQPRSAPAPQNQHIQTKNFGYNYPEPQSAYGYSDRANGNWVQTPKYEDQEFTYPPQSYGMPRPHQMNQAYNMGYQQQAPSPDYHESLVSPSGGHRSRGGQYSSSSAGSKGGHNNHGARGGSFQSQPQYDSRRYSSADQSAANGNRSTMLEDFRNSKNKKYDLKDIAGFVVEFSADQHGSRFIQQKLEIANSEDKAIIFREILPRCLELMTDVFGNYVIQKFFEFGLPEQRREMVTHMHGHILELAVQMYGCRVVQKAIEYVEQPTQLAIIRELDGNILRCIKDQNGNHVIQKAIEKLGPKEIEFIIEAFRGQVFQLATHPYGCRVMQRIFEHCPDYQTEILLQELRQFAPVLVQDQYGNYVMQHILEKGTAQDRALILDIVKGQVLALSKHKFASNVVEKCILFSGPNDRQVLIEEIVNSKTDGANALIQMMKDQYANYVVQKMLDIANDAQRDILVQKIRPHFASLKKFTYGKHIIAKIEKITANQ